MQLRSFGAPPGASLGTLKNLKCSRIPTASEALDVMSGFLEALVMKNWMTQLDLRCFDRRVHAQTDA